MLELLNLRKAYGSILALDGCSFQSEAGRVTGFLGPNGSGKTTSIRCIFGLAEPDGGEIRWKRERVTSNDHIRFGYMPEQRGLYPRMGAHEQLVYLARLHGVDTQPAHDAAGSWLDRLGLGDRRESKLEELSHGNQQRVQLAAALVHRPELIVLDEPFSGLDPLAVQVLAEVVREEAARGAAVVFSSHQLDLVEDICEDVAIIAEGRVVLAGELEELRQRSPARFVDVAVEGVPADQWLPQIEGVEILEETGGTARLRVPADLRADVLLSAAFRAGHVEYFRFEPPNLTQLFLEAVAS